MLQSHQGRALSAHRSLFLLFTLRPVEFKENGCSEGPQLFFLGEPPTRILKNSFFRNQKPHLLAPLFFFPPPPLQGQAASSAGYFFPSPPLFLLFLGFRTIALAAL